MVITQRWNSCITWSISLWILTNLIQIELDDLVVLAAFIWHQHVWVFISQGSDLWEETTVLWHQWVTAEKNIHTHFHYYSWVANCEFCTYVPVQSSPGRSSCGGCKGTRRLWLRSRLPCCRLWPFLQTKRLVVLLCYFYNISPSVVLYKSQTSEKENKLPQSGSFFSLTSARNRVNSWSVVLYDGSSTSLYSQDASHLQDDILRRRPARESARQLHTNNLRERQSENSEMGGETTRKNNWETEREQSFLLTFGHLSSQGIPAMTSTASAPPTPIQMAPSPPPLGVWESVPISITPG